MELEECLLLSTGLVGFKQRRGSVCVIHAYSALRPELNEDNDV
jgi:hypothetical protein